MKTKISSKNKNVINIKINTEKKKHKGRKRVKHSAPSNGKSSYNSGGGYAMMPPIIINSSQPYPQAVFNLLLNLLPNLLLNLFLNILINLIPILLRLPNQFLLLMCSRFQ